MYADFESILETMDPVELGSPNSSQPIPMKLINTRHLVGAFIGNSLTEMLIICLESIEAKIALKLFVITSKEKRIDCITCFPSYRWIL